MPEHAALTLVTSGPKGGDAGHGSWTKLTFRFESGSAAVRVADRNSRCMLDTDAANELPGVIEITVRGDWELEGLELALRHLGVHLLRCEMSEELDRWQ